MLKPALLAIVFVVSSVLAALAQFAPFMVNSAPVQGGGGPCPQYTALAQRTTDNFDVNAAAVQTLICGMVSDNAGSFPRLDAFYVLAANSPANAKLNWAQNNYNLTYHGNPLETSAFAANQGYTGDGTSVYLTSGFNPSTAAGNFQVSNASMGVCVANARSAIGNYWDLAATDGTNSAGLGWLQSSGMGYMLNNGTVSFIPGSSTQGSWVATRTSSTATAGYLNAGAPTVGTTVASAALPNGQMAVLAIGDGTDFSPDQVAYAFWGASLTPTQISQIYARLATYLNAVGFKTIACGASPPVPVVQNITPSNGAGAGGTSVTITGSNLTVGSTQPTVYFGQPTQAASITSFTPTQIVAVSPPGTTGNVVDVQVQTSLGISATSSADQFTYQAVPLVTYYMTTSGSDANNGLSPTAGSGCPSGSPGTCGPWATANHTLNCSTLGGDTLLVQPGTYSTGQLNSAWGPVGAGCQAGTFRTLKCNATTLGSCLFTLADFTLKPSTAYWIVQGLQVTSSTAGTSCVYMLGNNAGSGNPPVAPNMAHHIVFINNWIHDCQRAGYSGTDYFASIGDLVYGATFNSGIDSAYDFYEPYPWDFLAGTHIFIGGSFMVRTVPWAPTATCSLCGASDQEAVILDDWDFTQNGAAGTIIGQLPGNTCNGYPGQSVVEQSLIVSNSSSAWETNHIQACGATHYFQGNTTWGNQRSQVSEGTGGAEILLQGVAHAVFNNDLIMAGQATQQYCPGGNYTVTGGVLSCNAGFTTVNLTAFNNNGGSGTISYTDYYNTATPGSNFGNPGLTAGAGVINANPNFVAPAATTTAPDCSTYATVIQCMQGNQPGFTNGYVAAFTPGLGNVTLTGASDGGAIGYRLPQSCSTYLYTASWPAWIPPALITQIETQLGQNLLTHPCVPSAAAPTVSSIIPNRGPTAGGSAIVISGTNFTGATQVAYGTQTINCPSTNCTITSATQLNVTLGPSATAITVDIRVTNAAGQSAANPPNDQFTFIPPPAVSSCAVSGAACTAGYSTAGGTSVTLTGTSFSGTGFNTTAVKFGAVNAASFTVNSPTQITATSPAGAAGTVDITVTTTDTSTSVSYGTSATGPGDQFTYTGAVVALATYDPNNLQPHLNISANNLTITNQAFAPTTTTVSIARSTSSQPYGAGTAGGRYYFEVLNQEGAGLTGTPQVGLTDGNENGQIGSTVHSIGVESDLTNAGGGSPIVGCNASGANCNTTQGVGPLISNGHTFGVAVDFVNKLIWFRDTAVPGTWNNSTANHPGGSGGDAGVGGVSFAYMACPCFIASSVFLSNSIKSFTGNFGQNAYQAAMPAGYSNWGGGTGGATGPIVTPSGVAATYTIGGAAVRLDPNLTVTDTNPVNLASATVQITAGFVSSDTLNYPSQVGNITQLSNAGGLLTLQGNDTPANYQAALRSVTYSGGTTVSSRTVTWQVTEVTTTPPATTCAATPTAPSQSPYKTLSYCEDFSNTNATVDWNKTTNAGYNLYPYCSSPEDSVWFSVGGCGAVYGSITTADVTVTTNPNTLTFKGTNSGGNSSARLMTGTWNSSQNQWVGNGLFKPGFYLEYQMMWQSSVCSSFNSNNPLVWVFAAMPQLTAPSPPINYAEMDFESRFGDTGGQFGVSAGANCGPSMFLHIWTSNNNSSEWLGNTFNQMTAANITAAFGSSFSFNNVWHTYAVLWIPMSDNYNGVTGQGAIIRYLDNVQIGRIYTYTSSCSFCVGMENWFYPLYIGSGNGGGGPLPASFRNIHAWKK